MTTRLLIVDPLHLSFSSGEDSEKWSTREWFERAIRDIPELNYEIVDGRGDRLCERALKCGGVVLGGSENTAWEDTPFNDRLLDLIAICKHNEIPFMGICFGAQLLGRALGGRVERHPSGIELGAINIRLTKAGRKHPLFEGVSGGSFRSIETRNDAVMYLPSGCELLATSTHTPIQAFAWGNLLYGVQFHPEMNGQDLRNLWQGWTQTGHLNLIPHPYLQRLQKCECDELPQILRNFTKRVTSRVSELRV